MNTYVTIGVKESLPEEIILFLFDVVNNIKLNKRDYLQIFRLQKLSNKSEYGVIIEHTQEQPPFEKVYFLLNEKFNVSNIKLYLIIENDNQTLMVADEY